MNHFENLIIDTEWTVPGQITMIMVNLKVNGLTNEDWVDECPINEGDTLMYNGQKYRVNGVEVNHRITDGKIGSRVALYIVITG